MKKKTDHSSTDTAGYGISLGITFGVVFGLLLDNLGLGIALGIALGAAGGFGWGKKMRQITNLTPTRLMTTTRHKIK